jgi:hypothetical protein
MRVELCVSYVLCGSAVQHNHNNQPAKHQPTFLHQQQTTMRTLYITTIAIASLLTACGGGNKSYTNNAFEQSTAQHRLVAVLPAQVVLTGKKPDKLTDADIAKQELAESRAFQQSLYNNILRYANDKKNYTTVQVQPLDKTASLLKAKNIDFRDVASMDDKALCTALGVDAVVRMSIQKTRYMSGMAAYGGAVLNDAVFQTIGVFIPGTVVGVPKANTKTDDVIASCSVESNGAVLWNDSYTKEADWRRPANEIMEGITVKFGQNFPYKKKRN